MLPSTHRAKFWASDVLLGDDLLCPGEEPGTDMETQNLEGDPNCEDDTVPVHHQERTRTETSPGQWGEWSDWVTVSTSTREATDEECPPDVLGDEKEQRSVPGNPDCEAGTVTTSNQERTRTTTNGVPGPWSEWNEVSTSTLPPPRRCRSCPTEIETLPTESSAPGDPGQPEGEEPEVLGIAKKAPAAAPTAVAAGLGGEESSSNSTLWILAGGALALAGLTLGFAPATSRGKRAL